MPGGMRGACRIPAGDNEFLYHGVLPVLVNPDTGETAVIRLRLRSDTMLVMRAGVLVLLSCICLTSCDRPVARAPATKPTSQPTTAPATKPVVALDYMAWARTQNAQIPATQPLVLPVTLDEAACVVTKDPVYLDSTSTLWITRADAPPTEQALAEKSDAPRLVRDPVLFVQWTADDEGAFLPTIISRSVDGLIAISTKARTPLGFKHDYQWDRASSWDNMIVAPTRSGIGIIKLSPLSESYTDFATTKSAENPQWTLDAQGLLAWMPGSDAVPQRFVDGSWKPLADWPRNILHLIPLLDGSVLEILSSGPGTVEISGSSLVSAAIDEKHIEELVGQLSDFDAEKRQAAYGELLQVGPASWPVLERLKADQPPEAQSRLAQLLAEREHPTLGGFVPVHNKLTIAARLADGGCVLYAPDGVNYHEPNKTEPSTVSPAWLTVRPGRPIALLFSSFTHDAPPANALFIARGDEWIISEPIKGPQRFLGNHLEPLLPKSKRADFLDWLGIDRRGRWIFRSLSTQHSALSTLILDPTIADPAPRLPAWTLVVEKGIAGWSSEDWPVIKRGGGWALEAAGWKALDKNAPILTELPSVPTTAPADRLLLKEADGTQFFDGTSALRIRRADGTAQSWPLPVAVVGTGPVTLIRAGENRLFLFNQPGRVVRLIQEPAGVKVEATFTHDIPNSPTRIWKDPAGRIVIAHDRNKLNILFPTGRVPMELLPLVPSVSNE